MKLSIVLGGRDDNYGENFIERLNQAVSTNLQNLDEHGIDYEMIVVDFNPLDEVYLHTNESLKEALSHKKVRNIIVHNSVVCRENLNPTTYYEYFAKNVGCRHSTGDLILITNSDIILSKRLIQDIETELQNINKNDVFYRVRYRGEIPLGYTPDENTPAEDLHHPEFPDACICGLYSGDATMLSREVLFNVATGYNEGEVRHRTQFSQSAMDGEILWNVYKKGKQLKFLESPYYHISHGRPNPRDNFYSHDTYENKINWGFIKYPMHYVNENTTLIRV
jgi:hypothetical protein